jgi:molecular chaperone DnaK (HSP70)
VKPSYGLTDEEVERMILESFEYAEADLTQRQLIEARTEADSILAATEKSMKREEYQLLSETERAQIQQAVAELKEAKQGEDYKLVRERIDKLNQATYHLAEIMMDGAVQAALKGRSVDEVT